MKTIKRKTSVVIALILALTMMMGTFVNAFATENKSANYAGGISYQVHCQTYGTMDWVKDGQKAGTEGQAKRLESIRIKLDNPTDENGVEIPGTIEYSVHCQTYGWMDYVSNGQLAGTEGQAKRLEAIKIRLTGELAEQYDVFYRVHRQTYGTTEWKKNDEVCGTTGEAKRLESIEIKLAKKGSNDAPLTVDRIAVAPSVTYSTHVQTYGWLNPVSNGAVSGTVGEAKRMEALKLSMQNAVDDNGNVLTGDIQYSVHCQSYGWMNPVSNGALSGTEGQAKRLEAIKINLTGQMAELYDVWYRVQIQKHGWLGWAKNGQAAGSEGIAYRMEAVQIKLVPKGGTAPGANSGYFTTKAIVSYSDASMYNLIANRSSKTNWIIAVDTERCRVGIYSGRQGAWNEYAVWLCSPGKPSTPTVKGEFTVTGRGKAFGTNAYTCWYYTQFYGNYLFHSVLYAPGSMERITDGRLGQQLSHGCVRMDINQAKWIYDNIPNGTKVYIK